MKNDDIVRYMSNHNIPIDPKLASILEGRHMVFVDVETTGPSIINDKVISIGLAILFPSGEVTTHTNLFGGGRSSPRAFEVHKIPDSDRLYKKRFEDEAPLYAKMFDNSIMVGHNAKCFDIPLIWGAMKKAGVAFDATVLDTLKIARKIGLDKVAGKGSLGVLCEYMKIPYGNHNALGDALSTMALFVMLARRMDDPSLEKLKILCS